MTLKSARIARAEDLSPAERRAAGVEIDRGLIVLEIHNQHLRERGFPIENGGFRAYLLRHGPFQDTEL